MDKTQVNITLAFAQIKSFAEYLARHPDNETERMIGEHILTIIRRQFASED